jgi:hypothetical protein
MTTAKEHANARYQDCQLKYRYTCLKCLLFKFTVPASGKKVVRGPTKCCQNERDSRAHTLVIQKHQSLYTRERVVGVHNPLNVQRQMGHSTLMMTNQNYSQTVEQLQRTQELYSPLRMHKSEGEVEGGGSGYWDE